MLYDELVQRSRRRNEHCTRTSRTSSCAARPLPSGRNRSRITSHHARIERTNVDTKFECVSGDHSQDAAVAQTAFNLASFSGQIPPTIAPNRFWWAYLRRTRPLQIGEQ